MQGYQPPLFSELPAPLQSSLQGSLGSSVLSAQAPPLPAPLPLSGVPLKGSPRRGAGRAPAGGTCSCPLRASPVLSWALPSGARLLNSQLHLPFRLPPPKPFENFVGQLRVQQRPARVRRVELHGLVEGGRLLQFHVAVDDRLKDTRAVTLLKAPVGLGRDSRSAVEHCADHPQKD